MMKVDTMIKILEDQITEDNICEWLENKGYCYIRVI